MQTIRTGFWVLLAVIMTIFAAMNFHGVQVHVWPGGNAGYDYLEWPLALVIVASFLLGFLPMLLMYRTARWTAERKIRQQDETIALLRPAASPAAALYGDGHDTAPLSTASTTPQPLP